MTKDIYKASLRGDAKSLKAIIDSGADVSAQNDNGYTPLMAASHDGRLDCMELLLENGAEVNAQDESGFTALTIAVQHSTVEATSLLISNGADVNHSTKASFTPLMFVPYNNFPPTNKTTLSEVLIEKGANKTAKDGSGLSASDHALKKSLDDLANLLKP